MCQPGLFYFNWNITNGPPRETCLIKFKEFLHNRSGAFSMTSSFCGCTLLLMFFASSGLYFRPEKVEITDNVNQ